MRAFHLSSLGYRLALLTASLPLIAAWLVAFAGHAKLSEYTNMIRKTPEGPYFEKLAAGTGWLAWSLPVPALAALLLNALGNECRVFYSVSIIMVNYLNLLFALVAFSIIGAASRGLITHAKLKFSITASRVIVLIFLVAGVAYCYLTFRHLDLSSVASTHNPYYLPVWLMVLSVIIPYLYAWFVGLLAAYEIVLFGQRAEGVLYGQSLRLLASGLTVIIGSSVILQYIHGIQPRSNHLIFGAQTVWGVLLHMVAGIGFVLLLLGASRLKRIEEV